LPEYAQQLFSDAQGKEKFLGEIINKEMLHQEALKKAWIRHLIFRKKWKNSKR